MLIKKLIGKLRLLFAPKEKFMNELELVQAVVAAVVAGFSAGNTNPVVSLSEDSTQMVLTMTPSAVQPVVTSFPVTNPTEAA